MKKLHNKKTGYAGDMREADCLNFIEVNHDSTVLLMGGWSGHTVFALSRRCKKVLTLEPDSSQAEIESFVAGKVFDAIIIEEPAVLRATGKLYEALIQPLKSGGEIYIAVYRRRSFRLARNLVRLLGLQDIRCWLILPGHRTPLFFLPLYNMGAMSYFFRNLFYLIATIPPEKKGKYRFVAGMASVAAKILPVRLLAFLLRAAFLSKAIVARKS